MSHHPRLADLTTKQARKGLTVAVVAALVLVLFFLLVREVMVAAILGAIVAVYARPVYLWLEDRVGRKAPAAILVLVGLIVPFVVALVYSYLELRRAAEYLASNTEEVATRIAESISTLPFLGGVTAESLTAPLDGAAAAAVNLPATMQSAAAGFSVSVSVFLFTAFYVMTQAKSITAYIRRTIPPSYADLAEAFERNANGVLQGAIFATLVTQTAKALVILALNLLFGVPLPFTLAFAAFAIGFFPVLGSWSIFVPAGGYLMVFEGEPLLALAYIATAFFANTIFISMVLRPRLAAHRSHVLGFYWMFLGLVAGVYTFGVTGIVLGPLTVGMLKAVIDTIAGRDDEDDPDAPRAELLAEEKLGEPEPEPEPLAEPE